MNTHRLTLIASSLLTLALAAPAAAADFAVMPGNSSATFTSDALLETITGTTSQLAGLISVDTAAPAGASGNISFATSTLRTGVDLRDEHLHSDDWLGGGDVTFAITSVDTDAAGLTHGAAIDTTVTGELTIKGTTRTVSAPAAVTFYQVSDDQVAGTYGIENDVIRVATRFAIQLDDYGIDIPGPLQNKVSNTLTLDVRVTAQEQ